MLCMVACVCKNTYDSDMKTHVLAASFSAFPQLANFSLLRHTLHPISWGFFSHDNPGNEQHTCIGFLFLSLLSLTHIVCHSLCSLPGFLIF